MSAARGTSRRAQPRGHWAVLRTAGSVGTRLVLRHDRTSLHVTCMPAFLLHVISLPVSAFPPIGVEGEHFNLAKPKRCHIYKVWT